MQGRTKGFVVGAGIGATLGLIGAIALRPGLKPAVKFVLYPAIFFGLMGVIFNAPISKKEAAELAKNH